MVTSAILSWIKVASAFTFWLSHMINLETERHFLSCVVSTGQAWPVSQSHEGSGGKESLKPSLTIKLCSSVSESKVFIQMFFKEKWEIGAGLRWKCSIGWKYSACSYNFVCGKFCFILLRISTILLMGEFLPALLHHRTCLLFTVRSPIQILWTSGFIQSHDLTKPFKPEAKFQSCRWVLGSVQSTSQVSVESNPWRMTVLSLCQQCPKTLIFMAIYLVTKEKIKFCVCVCVKWERNRGTAANPEGN